MDGKQIKYTVDDIRNMLSSPEGTDTLSGIENSEVSVVVDLLHTEIQAIALKKESNSHDDEHRKRCIKCLQRLVRKHHILPDSLFVTNIKDTIPVSCCGGYSDIYRGNSGGQSICLKVLRVFIQDGKRHEDKDNESFRAFYKEALLWTQFSHPNILPFIGVNTTEFAGRFCLVSPWMMNGEIMKFLEKNPKHDKLTVIIEIAAGMSYLHSIDIVHADIKGANVLVDEQGQCQLADFGLAAPAVANTLITHATGNDHKGTTRWMAPELFAIEDNNESPKDKKTKFGRDVYAFAMTIVEIITGQCPFPNIKYDAGVIYQVTVLDKRPEQPTTVGIWCPSTIWLLLQHCWDKKTDIRPSADNIHSFLLFIQNLRYSYLPWESPGYLVNLDKELPNFQSLLTTLSGGYDGIHPHLPSSSLVNNVLLTLEKAPDTLLSLEGSRIAPVLDVLLTEAKSMDLNHEYSQKCMKILRQLVNKYYILPPSLFLNEVTMGSPHMVNIGGFSDIYQGTYQQQLVCLKVIRMFIEDSEERRDKNLHEIYHETLLWTQLNHPNILPFLGVNTMLFPGKLALVTPWMVNGSITEFLKVNPDYDKLRAISEIAAGIMYLHSHNIVHGCIKGSDILVDEQGRCYLTDFGLALAAMSGPFSSSGIGRGAIRWMAPEVFTSESQDYLNNSKHNIKLARDIYAYACTVYEIVAGEIPFPHLTDVRVIIQVVNGERPKRPATVAWCPANVWALVEQCWAQRSHLRPTASVVHGFLSRLERLRAEGLPWEEEFPDPVQENK
ncbi:kinase-like protein [Marasmius fiardii PR-910]|nr:kinase-like protein [Marasmius fiardii PR-910]